MRVVWTLRALRNLHEIARYLTQINPIASLATVRLVRAAPHRLRQYPASGRPGRVEGTRELIIVGSSYILPYRVTDDRVEILAVLHASQQWPDQF